MTTAWREVVACPRCGCPVSTDQPIKAWIRGHDELDSRRACLCIGDSDMWVQRYGTRTTRRGTDRDVQYLMLVEIKTNGRDLDNSQRDMLEIVNDLLRTNTWRDHRTAGLFMAGHQQNARTVFSRMSGRMVQVYCYGVHVLRLTGSTPEDSDRITWDKKPITTDQLAQILRYDLSPDSLRPLEHRQHKRKVIEPTLFPQESA